jgi:hypothetical protein
MPGGLYVDAGQSLGQAEVWKLDQEFRGEQDAAVQLAATNTLNLSAESVTLYILGAD